MPMSNPLLIHLKGRQMQCRRNVGRSQLQSCRGVACGACWSYRCNPAIRHLGCIVSTQQSPGGQRRWPSVDCHGPIELGTRSPLYATGQPALGCCSGLHAGPFLSPQSDCIYLVELRGSLNDCGDMSLYLAGWRQIWQDLRQLQHLVLQIVDALGAQMGPRSVGGCA